MGGTWHNSSLTCGSAQKFDRKMEMVNIFYTLGRLIKKIEQDQGG
jgi:hypothetical protein